MQPKSNVYHRLLQSLVSYYPQVSLAYAAMVISTVLNLFVPQILKTAIDRGLAADQPGTLLISGGIILAIAAIRGAAGFLRTYLGFWLSHRVAYDLRNRYYDSVQRLPFDFHDRTRTGDLMSRATSDISETERFIGVGLMELVATVLLISGVVIAMLIEDPKLAVLGLLPMPVLILATVRFGGIVRPLFLRIQEQLGALSTTMQESMTGIRLVKAFAREPYELAKFDRGNRRWFDLRYDLIGVWANNWPLFTLILASGILLLLSVGGPQALRGEITIGSLFALISYLLLLNGPVQRLGFLVNLAATNGASATRVFEIIDTPNEIIQRPGARPLPRRAAEVAFEGVSFAYRDGPPILRQVNFRASPGESVALIGPTGSGKSTIINLIPRFYDPTKGRVTVNGVDIRQLSLDSLRQQIGIVLQDPFLFSTTIRENIAYGRPNAGHDEIVAAAKAAHAHDFITRFAHAYETRVGERGVTLSGGQKQRIAIARALITDPQILILDDSTSSVDTETEHLIQQALAALMRGRTTFIIAQRLLTLKNADCILVLRDGRIVERGRHTELLAHGGLYRQIYDLQLRDQESAGGR